VGGGGGPYFKVPGKYSLKAYSEVFNFVEVNYTFYGYPDTRRVQRDRGLIKYSNNELEPWIPKVEEVSGKVKKLVGYFNNHYHGYTPENCLYLIERLGLLSEEQKLAKERKKKKQAQLGTFM
jgi:uncharacterized protein YecE (DUF72 family)